MPRERPFLLAVGIPGLLLFGVLVTLQWRSALALSEFRVLQTDYPPDSQHPSPAAVLGRKMTRLAEAARLAPTDPEPAYQLALLNLVRAEATSLSPTDSSAHLGSGPDRGLKVMLTAGLRAIRQAILRNPGVAEYHLTAALLLQNLSGTDLEGPTGTGSEKAVMAHLGTSGVLDPYKPSLHFRLGSFQVALGDREAAKRDFAVALMDGYHFARPVFDVLWSSVEDVEELRRFLNGEPLTHALLADFLWTHGYQSEAEKEYHLAESRHPIECRTGELLIQQGFRTGNLPRVQETIATLERHRDDLTPYQLARLRYFGGQAFFLEKRYEEAVAALEKALEIDPHVYYVHEALGDAFVQVGDYDRAISRYRLVLDKTRNLTPKQAAALHVKVAKVHEKRQQFVQALEQYFIAVRLDPANEVAQRRADELSREHL